MISCSSHVRNAARQYDALILPDVDRLFLFNSCPTGSEAAENDCQHTLENGNVLRTAILAVPPFPPHRPHVPFLYFEVAAITQIIGLHEGPHRPAGFCIADASPDVGGAEHHATVIFPGHDSEPFPLL
jgi:hypothetical protein